MPSRRGFVRFRSLVMALATLIPVTGRRISHAHGMPASPYQRTQAGPLRTARTCNSTPELPVIASA
jgi:hypothetical protein